MHFFRSDFPLLSFRLWRYTFFHVVFLLHGAHAFYLPGSYMKKFASGEELSVKVNSLTSIHANLLFGYYTGPFGYYTLPYCKPQEGVQKSVENLGEVLEGDLIENSPYRFHMNRNETSIFLCTTPKLSKHDAELFKQRIDDLYQINLILDNLPAVRYTLQDRFYRWPGTPVGFRGFPDNNYYVVNHLKFSVFIHEFEDAGMRAVMSKGDGLDVISTEMAKPGENSTSAFLVVGFEVSPCTIRHDAASVANLKMYNKISPELVCDASPNQLLQVGDQITFSYEVSFSKSDIQWPSRWDSYLKMNGAGERVHFFSILTSLMLIAFLAGIVFIIFLRTVRRDLAKYEELDKEAQAQMAKEFSGWKLVAGDVFRAPPHSELLCIMVGDGVQITGMAVVTILFAALGFMSPASRGMLLIGMIVLYLFLGIAAGYVAVRLLRTLTGDTSRWRSIAWRVACFFPGTAFGIMTVLDILLWATHSTGAIPISLFFSFLALWFCISVPLSILGGFLGLKAEHIQYPVLTNQIPRKIPHQKYPSWLLVVGAGTLPFGTVFVELFFLMSSIWLGRIYVVGFLFIVLILLVIVCCEVSVVLTYMHLFVGDWRWWWKSFFASGSVALYVFLYAINFLVFELRNLTGPVSAIVYMGYTVLMVFAIMLATGTIGFLSSFLFVRYLFSSIKID